MPGVRRWTSGHDTSDLTSKSRPLRLVSVVVLLALIGLTVAGSLVTRHLAQSQERLILKERTSEVATLVGELFTGVQPALRLLGTVARLEPGNTQEFSQTAKSQTATGAFIVVTQRNSVFTVTASAGMDPGVGATLSGSRALLARRALSTDQLVSGFVAEGSQPQLAIALGGAAGPGTVVLESSPITPTTPVPSTASSPFRSLDIALYKAPQPNPSDLLVTTVAHLPLTGTTVRQQIAVGADTWLIVARSQTPLIGSVATAMPWIILVLGLVGAALLTAVVETLSRRRVYASRLVAERTASLQTAMTELERSRDELVLHERLAAVGQLASSVGHELRNPLGVLMNVIYLMEAGTAGNGNESLGRHLATARREVSAATLIVSDLLDYATARGPISARVDVCELMAEALTVIPSPSGAEVVTQCEGEVTIDADRDQLRQVLLNLITNAYDAMPEGGVLTVAAKEVPGAAQITISDTGMGMDEDTRNSIFQPFFSSKARGIGLGLSVTKRIVESHCGTIAVESTPGAGTSFILTIPSVAAMASAPA